MNNKVEDAQYYKERIKEFSRYNEEELYKFFKSIRYGTIIMSYPNSLEQEIYRYLASILKRRYPKYCDEDDILNTLLSYGNIYTAKIDKRLDSGIYHINSANVLIYSFLNKLNESLVHELIHKLGFLKFNDDFYNMPKIYLEAGTETITNSVLNKPICRELLLENMWVKSIGVQPRYLVESTLVNQLNAACGNEPLERSILEGRNYIEAELKELIGEEKYALLFTNLTDICRLEKNYWKSKKSKTIANSIHVRIDQYQDLILEEIFSRRIEKVKTKDEAQAILNELMSFSDYRVKIQKDEKFKKYFQVQKQRLEEKFATIFNVADILDTWEERHPIIMLDESILKSEDDEKRRIDSMAEERSSKQKGLFSRLFGKKQKNISNSFSGKFLERISFQYKGDYINNCPVEKNEKALNMKLEEIEK